ncbi:thymidylate synthase [Williamsoniiplasma somnilux]|uniref:Thymidylate synthase n=1 Tax=Williamsoniiplasma somnilux TaxID=215578 RepID=A0A2K8NZN6_9MOLU|nr:thymidylate synthase [Williamsoniiplasma somnilux]ATZ18678.1 thymidylate synthase [Williamsoniiplasma somnilux]
MKQYLDVLKNVLENGIKKQDRTGTGTISLFATQARYDLREGFPLVTTKKVFYKGIFHELLWFIAGDTNIKYLVDNKVNIWNEWPYEAFKKSADFNNESLAEFVEKIKTNIDFANKYGNLGPVYGKQWRNFNGVDQLEWIINEIKKNPFSRRLIVSAWNPTEIGQMALPPCHTMFQFYVTENKNGKNILNIQLYQRSADLFLGVPFNIASYALLLFLVAQECDLIAGEFVHTTGDTHIYLNHVEQAKLQLSRTPHKLPKIAVKNFTSIFDVKFEDIEIIDYEFDAPIKGEVAV